MLSVCRIRVLVALLTLVAGPAAAADLAVESPPVPARVRSWTGVYGGVAVGARWNDDRWTSSDPAPIFGLNNTSPANPTDTLAAIAAYGNVYAGFNWQVSAVVVGVEADAGLANTSKSALVAPGLAGAVGLVCGGVCTNLPSGFAKSSWDSSLRARVGVLITPDTLLFATAGVAWSSLTIGAACVAGGGPNAFCRVAEDVAHLTTRTGWTAGGGIEWRVLGPWLVRVAYRYSEFPSLAQQLLTAVLPVPGGFDDRFTAAVKLRTQTLTFGVGVLF